MRIVTPKSLESVKTCTKEEYDEWFEIHAQYGYQVANVLFPCVKVAEHQLMTSDRNIITTDGEIIKLPEDLKKEAFHNLEMLTYYSGINAHYRQDAKIYMLHLAEVSYKENKVEATLNNVPTCCGCKKEITEEMGAVAIGDNLYLCDSCIEAVNKVKNEHQ